mgnify:CR=1 FL=1
MVSSHSELRVLEVVQSLKKGGRTIRFSDTVAGLRKQKIFTHALCFSNPCASVNIPNLQICHKTRGINWQLIFQIRKTIKHNQINLIHAHCEFSQLYASIAGFSCGVKTVATFHRSDLSKYQPSMVNTLIKLFSAHFIAVSHDRLSLLTKNLQLAPTKCAVVHGGAHIQEKPTHASIQRARQDVDIMPHNTILLSIGHLGAIKGHQDTLLALAHLIEKNSNLHLYIAGDGTAKQKNALLALVQSLDIKQHITFLGQVSNAPTWLEACDIFIQPSIEEAFGLVFVEAGAKAKPTVATNVGGIKEIIVHEETGILVTPASPNELTEAIARLITSKPLRVQYGENAFKRISKHFSIDHMIKQYQKIFQQVIDS